VHTSLTVVVGELEEETGQATERLGDLVDAKSDVFYREHRVCCPDPLDQLVMEPLLLASPARA
jgi:hypothetical protein